MHIDRKYLDIKEYCGEGYMPVVDYEKWRVAVLNYCEELETKNITEMQRHDLTDEVFVLLNGEFILFIGKGDETVDDVISVKLEPFKMYNVKRGVWHTHTLSLDASVLIIENSDTCDENSPVVEFSKEIRMKMLKDSSVLLENK